MSFIFHPLQSLIASATDRQLAQYIQFLKEENKILRARIPGVIHTRPDERERLVKFGKAIGRAIEGLITIVSPSTFYRLRREEDGQPKRKKNPKGGQRKPREIRELIIQIAIVTGFGYTLIIGRIEKARHQEDQPADGEEHSQRRGDFAGSQSHLRLLDELSGATQGDTVGQ